MVFWLLSILSNRDKDEMSRTLLALSSSADSCIAMRKSGCVPLLVQILHDGSGSSGRLEPAASGATLTGCSREAKSRASATLHNIIFAQQDEGQARREKRVLHLLERIRTYCDSGWDWMEEHTETSTGSRSAGNEGFTPTVETTSKNYSAVKNLLFLRRNVGPCECDSYIFLLIMLQMNDRCPGTDGPPDLSGCLCHHETLLRGGVPACPERAGSVKDEYRL